MKIAMDRAGERIGTVIGIGEGKGFCGLDGKDDGIEYNKDKDGRLGPAGECVSISEYRRDQTYSARASDQPSPIPPASVVWRQAPVPPPVRRLVTP